MEYSISIVSELLSLVERVEGIDRKRSRGGQMSNRLSREDLAKALADVLAAGVDTEQSQRDIPKCPLIEASEWPAQLRHTGVAARIARRLGVSKRTLHGAVHAHHRPVRGSLFDSEDTDLTQRARPTTPNRQ